MDYSRLKARREAEARKKEQNKKERIKAREEFLKMEEQRLHDVNVMHQWEVMNRWVKIEEKQVKEEQVKIMDRLMDTYYYYLKLQVQEWWTVRSLPREIASGEDSQG